MYKCLQYTIGNLICLVILRDKTIDDKLTYPNNDKQNLKSVNYKSLLNSLKTAYFEQTCQNLKLPKDFKLTNEIMHIKTKGTRKFSAHHPFPP